MRLLWTCCIVLTAALSSIACQSQSPSEVASASAASSSAASTTADTPNIRGQATFPQRLKLAPGAWFQVQLLDNQLADTPAAMIAERTYRDVAGPPYVFELPYDPVKLRADGSYGLHASLRSADGQLLFVTDTRVPYTPGNDDVGEFQMTMVDSSGNANDAAVSPWQDAKARGIGFRGLGTEPGWLVEVGMGEAPALHAELDYGQRTVDVARAQPLAGSPGFAGTTADGVAVELRLAREPCSDGMSDTQYPASAELVVGADHYQGCGRFLFE